MIATNAGRTQKMMAQRVTFCGLTSGGCAGVATALFILVPDGQAAAAAAVFALAAVLLAILPLVNGRLG